MEAGPISVVTSEFPPTTAAVAPLRAKAEGLGSGELSPWRAGQNVSGCQEIPASTLTKQQEGSLKASRASKHQTTTMIVMSW